MRSCNMTNNHYLWIREILPRHGTTTPTIIFQYVMTLQTQANPILTHAKHRHNNKRNLSPIRSTPRLRFQVLTLGTYKRHSKRWFRITLPPKFIFIFSLQILLLFSCRRCNGTPTLSGYILQDSFNSYTT